ncbi:hypothetical protein [Xanthomonas translucens]|uniref:hypothetical protein n=1 Tax=Xanthomonas campestris pv. translucens TaxID=343 RepID=UPI0009BC967A|nr:hypothetical protein [Xanthomonas translucens]
MGNINRCFRSGESSARYQQDEHAQGSATPGAPHERDPYQPIVSNDPALAGLRPRVSNAPVHQRGVATNEGGLQSARNRAQQLKDRIAAQVAYGYPGLQPLVNRLDGMLVRINEKLQGTRSGGSGPDEYLTQIEQVRGEFSRFNREAPDPVQDFAHSVQLYDPAQNPFRPR